MCVGTYLPFQTTYYLNGHNFMEIELRCQGVAFRKDDNAFLATADPKALQAAADKLSAATIEKRLNYWSWLLGPKFSEKDRKAVNLDRKYSINQIEYCRNFVFKRHFPIHKIFEQSCEMGLFRLAADKVAYIFGVRVTKRLRGKLYSVLEKLDHGHHVLRIYCKNLVGRMYEKFSTFLRVEVCVNRMKDLGLNKGLENLGRLRQTLRRDYRPLRRFRSAILERPRRLSFVSTDGSAHHGRQNQNRRHQDSRYPDDAADGGAAARRHTIERMAVNRHPPSHPHHLWPVGHHLHPLPTPIRSSQTESPRTARTHRNREDSYRLTDKGVKAALMFILFHKRVCGTLANSLFHHRPDETLKPASKVETAYDKADHAIQRVFERLRRENCERQNLLTFGYARN